MQQQIADGTADQASFDAIDLVTNLTVLPDRVTPATPATLPDSPEASYARAAKARLY